MARPIQNGFVYFNFDVNFLLDPKIKAVRGRFGCDGLMLYIHLLCLIYDNGYYIQLDDDFADIMSDDLKMSAEKIELIINFLLRKSLFEYTLFKADKVLTSRSIQRRFQAMAKSKKRDVEVNENFWLLNENETESFIKVTHFRNLSQKNNSFSEKNSDKSRKNDTNKNKQNKNKINKNIYTAYLSNIVEAWNGLSAYGVPKVLSLSDKRKKALTKLLDEHGVENVFKAVNMILDSDFLLGKTSDWKIDFDFFLRPDKFLKILEGGYATTKKVTSKQNDHDQRQYDNDVLDAIVNNFEED